MDTSGNIDEHGLIKLKLYKLYLERYLSVLLASRQYKKVVIHDLLAGKGRSNNNQDGSAVVAAKAVLEAKKKFPPPKFNTEILLNLNELDPTNYSELTKHTENFSFVNLSNLDANIYVEQLNIAPNSHNLFFIDPFGYTILSQNIQKLFEIPHADFLIFIPIASIYRFLNGDGSPQYAPIADFLNNFNIGKEDAKKTNSPEEFARLIEDSLKRKTKADFAYHYILQAGKNKYALFFITHHILGAEKFIEAKEDLKEDLRRNKAQGAFDFVHEMEKPSLLNIIERGKAYNNCELYKIGIIAGMQPKDTRSQLVELEAQGKIEIIDLPGKKRRAKGFYISYEKYKNRDTIIQVTFKE